MENVSKPETNTLAESPDLASQGQALEPQENKAKPEPKKKLPFGKMLVAGIVILITLLAFGLIAYLMMGNQTKQSAITTYEECVAAGYPIMESYPEQCAANGQTFTRILSEEEQKKLDPTANWNTYIGDGYSFNYPPNWSYTLCPENFPENFICSEQISDPNTPSASFSYVITSGNDNPPESAEGIGIINYNEDTINGSQVLRTDEIPGASGSDSVYFKNENSYTYLAISPYNKADSYTSQENMHDQFNQILSTFKFTE